MKASQTPRVVLEAMTAKDLMRPDPVSIDESATIREGVAFLVDKGISAAPVIDGAGRPVGVLSCADVLVHDRERSHYRAPGDNRGRADNVSNQEVDQTPIREIMTPAVYFVRPDAPVTEVIRQMVGLKVHRLFVVDPDGALVGIISTTDVLRQLRVENSLSPAPEKSADTAAPTHFAAPAARSSVARRR